MECECEAEGLSVVGVVGQYIVWVHRERGGWELFGSSDDWDEAGSLRLEAIESCGVCEDRILVTENKTRLLERITRKPMSEWLQELEIVLLGLDDCEVDCDGITWAVSHLLREAGIPHECRCGFVRDERRKDIVTPHLWVVLDGGWIVDLRLRKWLGDEDDIPHGVFHPDNEPRVSYRGTAIREREIERPDESLLDMMTDGVVFQLRCPRQPVGG